VSRIASAGNRGGLPTTVQHPSQQPHPQGPARSPRRLTHCKGHLVQGVLDQRVVQGPEHQRPGHRGPPGRSHPQLVPQHHAGAPMIAATAGVHLEAVVAMEPGRSGEPKPHPPARLVGHHFVADRAMPATGPQPERAVEPHRRPPPTRPQAIVRARKRVHQRSDRVDVGVEPALVDVGHLHTPIIATLLQ
jgi:hypothetical protein